MVPDKRALQILTGIFWSSAGWKREQTVSLEDFTYAKAQGSMFDPVTLTHDEVTSAAVDAVTGTSREAVSHAFLTSLGSRRLDLRSAMGSYAVGRHMMAHQPVSSAGSRGCAYCGAYDSAETDPNLLNFERFKWGGVRHENVRYIALDLKLFASVEHVAPSTRDFSIMRSILEAVDSMPPRARLDDLQRALSKLLPSNDAERRTLIGILGYAGILVDPSRPDFRHRFVPSEDREHVPWN